MRNENLPDIYAEEQMPPGIQEKIAILESAGQAALIPEAQRELQGCIERAYRTAQKYIRLYMERDVRARDGYRRSLRGQIHVPNKLTIERIIQEEIRNDDEILLRPLYRGRTSESWQHV